MPGRGRIGVSIAPHDVVVHLVADLQRPVRSLPLERAGRGARWSAAADRCGRPPAAGSSAVGSPVSSSSTGAVRGGDLLPAEADHDVAHRLGVMVMRWPSVMGVTTAHPDAFRSGAPEQLPPMLRPVTVGQTAAPPRPTLNMLAVPPCDPPLVRARDQCHPPRAVWAAAAGRRWPAAGRPGPVAGGPGPRGPPGLVRRHRRGRGHPVGQDRRLPGGLPLLRPVVPLRHACAGHPFPRHRTGARSGPPDGRAGRQRVLHRAGRAGSGRANHATAARTGAPGAGRDRAQRGGVGGDPRPVPGRAPGRRWCPPVQPQPRNGPVLFPPDRHDPHLGRALPDLPRGAPQPAWSCAAASCSAWARPTPSGWS